MDVLLLVTTIIQIKTLQNNITMWVYIKSEPGLWTVGFYDPSGKWHPESDHDTPEKAAERVNYLNGH